MNPDTEGTTNKIKINNIIQRTLIQKVRQTKSAFKKTLQCPSRSGLNVRHSRCVFQTKR
jgi:hypothetical protein